MENESDNKKVKKEIKELKEYAKTYSWNDIKTGNWFSKFLTYALKQYAKKVNAEYFNKKYPDLPKDAIIERRIELAKKYTAIEGIINSGVYSFAIITTIGTRGGSSSITIPAAAVSFLADLMYTTKLQIQLAYDLSVLYKQEINIEDPEDLYDLIRIAFGVKAGEILREGASRAAPEATRQMIKSVIKGKVLNWLQKLPILGKYLLQRNIIKFSIPIVTIPLCTAVNYFSTNQIAKFAKKIYRDRASINEESYRILEITIDRELLLNTIWMVIISDKKVSAEESWFLKKVTELIKEEEGGYEILKKFTKIINLDENKVIDNIKNLNPAIKKQLYDVVCYTAAINHKINKEKIKTLKIIAKTCNIEYSMEKINFLIKKGK